jgi:4-hydroxybenzoate polyprenyltransferase
MKQIFIFVIALFAAVFAVTWTFNHINAWVGIATGVLVTYLFADQILKKTTKK